MKITGFGVTVENPPRFVLMSLLVLATSYGAYRLVREPELTILTLQEAQAALKATMDEYDRHIFEMAEQEVSLFDDMRGALRVRMFSDGCLLLHRRTADGSTTRLVQDLAKVPVRRTAGSGPTRGPFLAVSTAGLVGRSSQGCAGQCWDGHQGPFSSWQGARYQGCWVEVWRRWQDGCTHVQMFNPCSGSWATNPDGSPQVTWTCCVH